MTNVKQHIKKLQQKYNTLNPQELCEYMDIEIIKTDLPKHIRGFFVNIMKQDFIYINSRLDEIEQEIVLCHELGHTVMHSNLNYIYMSSSTLMSTSKYEVEADLFASLMLLDESVFEDAYNDNITLDEISHKTGIPMYYIKLRWDNLVATSY